MPARQTTELEFRAAGNEQVEKALRDIGITGRESFERLERLSRNLNTQLTRVSRNSNLIQSGFGRAKRELVAFGAGAIGVSAVSSAVTSAVKSMADFEVALANVGTLGNQSADAMEAFRTGLIDIDARLGTTTDLARGLYQTLSAGIEDDPLGFLTTSAELAKAGLTDIATSVDILSTITNAYGQTAAEAGRNSDILFKTVEQGKTTVEELARQLGGVIPVAASLGFGLEDVSAAMATLTAGGLSTDRAATALRSAFNQLISRADTFTEAGINLKEVIGTRGLVGVMEELREKTGGSAELLREFIQDTEGLTAALALTGNQFDTLKDKLGIITNSEGATLVAVDRQTKTLTARWNEFSATLDKFAQRAAPPVLERLSGLLSGVTELLDPQANVDREDNALKLLTEELENAQHALDALDERSRVSKFFDNIFGAPEVELFKKRIDFAEKEIARLIALADPLGDLGFIGPGNTPIKPGPSESDENERRAKAATKARKEKAEADKKAAEEAKKLLETQKKAELQILQDFADAVAEGEEELLEMEKERLEEEERLSRDALRIRLEMIDEEVDAYTDSLLKQLKAAEEFKAEQDELAEEASKARIRELERAEERYNDFVSNTVENFVEALGNGDIIDGFKSLAQDLVNENIFEPLYKDISDNLQNAFSNIGVGSSPEINVSTRGATSQAADSVGGAIAQQSSTQGGEQQGGSGSGFGSFASGIGGIAQGIGTQGAIEGLFNGGNFRNTTYGRAFEFAGDTGQNVLGGAANGAAIGTTILPGWGTLIGGLAGALVGGLNVVFGGRQGSRAELVTGNVDQDLLSDRASRRGAFGQVGFLNEGSLRLDAGRAAGVIANIDDEIAALISDRQEAIVAEVIQQQQSAQGGSELFSGDTENDIVGQIIKSRLDDTLNALGGAGFAEQVFGDYDVNLENVESITETFRDALDVLGALDAIRNPVENLTIAEQAIDVINDRFDELTDTAERFGLAASEVAEIEAERASQLEAIGTDFNDEIRQQILSITDPYEAALNDLLEVQEDRLREAIAAGGDQGDVIRLALLEQQQLEEQFVDAQVSVLESNLDRLSGLLDGVENFTQAERQFQSLTDRFDQMREAALDAGLGVDEVTRAYQNSFNDITRTINENIQQEILQLNDPFEAAIRDLVEQQREAYRNVQSAGGNIAGLLQLQRLQQENLFEQFNQAVGASSSAITDFIADLGTSERSGLGVQLRLENANEIFQQALQGDDETAAIQAAGTLIDLFRERFGSTTDFTAGREAVTEALESFRQRQEIEAGPENDFEAFLLRFEEVQHIENTEQFGGLRESIDQQREAEAADRQRQIAIQQQNATSIQSMLAVLEEQADRGALDTAQLLELVENTNTTSLLTRRLVELFSQLTAEQLTA